MKILFIHHGSVPGGAPVSLYNMISGLLRAGNVDITVYCVYESMIPFFEQIKGIKVKKYCQPTIISGKVFIGWAKIFNIRTAIYTFIELLKIPLTIYKETKILQQEKNAIVHLNSSILWSTAIAARICNRTLVWHVRETFIGGKFNFRRIFYAWLLKRLADKVICISRSEAQSINWQATGNVSVIYNSIDFSSFVSLGDIVVQERKKNNIPVNSFVILSLGGFSFRKGACQLIDAIKFLDDNCHLVIAGSHTLLAESNTTIIKKMLFKLEDIFCLAQIKKYYSWNYNSRLAYSFTNSDPLKIHFAGILDDVAPAIGACDVLVFAGTTPHFARPVFEAWAMKKPVIVFDTEVMRTEVEDGIDGIIVKKHTGKALAEAVMKLKNNPALAKKIGQAGYKKSLRKFNLHKNTEKILSIYKVLSEDRL